MAPDRYSLSIPVASLKFAKKDPLFKKYEALAKYPLLFVTKKNILPFEDYDYTPEALTIWVDKQTQPALKKISSVKELQALMERGDFILQYVSKPKASQLLKLASVIRYFDVVGKYTDSADIFKREKLTKDFALIYFDKRGYSSKIESDKEFPYQ